MVNLSVSIRELLTYLGKGIVQSTLLTISANTTATESTAPDNVEGSVAFAPQLQDNGILALDMTVEGAQIGKVNYDFLVNATKGRLAGYAPATVQPVLLGFFTRKPQFNIVNAGAGSVVVTLNSISLVEYDWRQILKQLAYQAQAPYADILAPVA